jgi:hypothetical protein
MAGSLVYSLGNVIPDPKIVAGMSLTAGQRIGVTGSGANAVGLELLDSASIVGGIFPGPQPPLQFYDEPVRSQLYAKVQRLGPDLDGKFIYDVAGRLSGQWDWEGGTLPYPVWFAYDTYDPSQPRLALSYPFPTAGIFSVGPGDPDPASISVASGLVRYTLTKSRTGLPLNAGPGGTLLVQMISDTRVRAEWFADGTSASSFTVNANTFARGFCAPRSIPPC